jgi:hypothetical protein
MRRVSYLKLADSGGAAASEAFPLSSRNLKLPTGAPSENSVQSGLNFASKRS